MSNPLFDADVDATTTRRAYVEAVRAADAHDLSPLIAFARS